MPFFLTFAGGALTTTGTVSLLIGEPTASGLLIAGLGLMGAGFAEISRRRKKTGGSDHA